MVEFRPKKDSIRDVALPDDLYLLLKKFGNDSMCNLVFPTRSGRANTKLWDACQRIAYQAGLDTRKFKPKNFRSTYATNRLRNGYTLAEVRDQLGHRNMGCRGALCRCAESRRIRQEWPCHRRVGLRASV